MAQYDFKEIYEAQKAAIWRLVARYVRTRHDREDLFQEIFWRVHRALPKFRGDAQINTWIYRVAVNTALTYLKRQRRYAFIQNAFSQLRWDKHSEPVEPDTSTLDKPLTKLNPKQRMILVLSDIEDKSLAEIAWIMKLPLGTIKSTLHRAREIIKKELMKSNAL